MDIAAIEGSPIGQLTPIDGHDPRTGRAYRHFAFVPDPLPDLIELDQGTWTAVAEATGALGQLRQVCAQLPNPALLITPALTKEAQATSALEGTYGALPEVMEARLPGFEPRTPEIREIRAYEEMAHYGFASIADRPITVGLLCELQAILARGSKHHTHDSGRVRTFQVAIGPEDCSVPDSRFVPPPSGNQLTDGLEAWVEWVNKPHELPVVLKAALAHYQFETLHPFADGNGRLGRLVVLLQLLAANTLEAPALTISPWLLRRRSAYQDHLLNVSRTGDWGPWVRFFCQALSEQAIAHVDVAKQLLDWMENVRSQINDRHWSGHIVELSQQLIDWPIVTAAWVTETHRVSTPTAQRSIDRLVEIGVLEELTGRSYARVYGARPVMDLVESL